MNNRTIQKETMVPRAFDFAHLDYPPWENYKDFKGCHDEPRYKGDYNVCKRSIVEDYSPGLAVPTEAIHLHGVLDGCSAGASMSVWPNPVYVSITAETVDIRTTNWHAIITSGASKLTNAPEARVQTRGMAVETGRPG
jgi:hypothetical protein